MAQLIYSFAKTIPASTPKDSPVILDMTFDQAIVSAIRWRVPPGPRGLMGFAIGAAGTRVLPLGADQWIVADDEYDKWVLEKQLQTGAWQLQGYNTGIYDHTVYVQFEADPIGYAAGAAAVSTPLTASQLAAASVPASFLSASGAPGAALPAIVVPSTAETSIVPYGPSQAATTVDLANAAIGAQQAAVPANAGLPAGTELQPFSATSVALVGGGTAVAVPIERAAYVSGTPQQVQQGMGYGPNGEGTWQQQQLVNAGLEEWAAPGVQVPTSKGSGPAGASAALATLGLSPTQQAQTVSASGAQGTTTLASALGITHTAAVPAQTARQAAIPKLQGYIADLEAVKHPTAAQSAELATYKARLQTYRGG